MTPMQFELPSKTFLLGEYLALQKGPSLIVNTEPRFCIEAKLANDFAIHGIHPDSPAGKYIQDHVDYFQQYQLDFHDPHQGKGGCGASSAQFGFAYALHRFKDDLQSIQEGSAVLALLETHQHYTRQEQGFSPSGHDLIAQFIGNISFFSPEQGSLQSFPWPFQEMGFLLARTGFKIATHEHLAQLEKIESKPLENIFFAAMDYFLRADSHDFAHCVKQYANALQEQNLVAKETLDLTKRIEDLQGVMACKGCGALGADILLILVNKEEQDPLHAWLSAQGVDIIADDKTISHGILDNE